MSGATADTVRSGTATLLRLDARRLAAALRHPAPGTWLGLVLPLVLLLGLLRAVGTTRAPAVGDAEGAVLLGLLLSGPVAFAAYSVVFRAADDPFLRRLGIAPRALFAERALRLLLLSLALAGLIQVPFVAAGGDPARPLAVALAAALAAWGGSLAAVAWAASAMARATPGAGWGCLTAGMWDRELAGAAPLVYAPLPGFLLGAAAAGYAGASSGAPWARTVAVAVPAVGLALLARRWHARALPRFAPQALEMTFAPPPAAGGELRVRRGAARLLPRGAAAVWARDAAVASRRLAWASRLVWPVAILSVVALARWGEASTTRAWVAGGALLALLVQAAAVVELGRLERRGRRWIDRALGLGWAQRLLGRWAWGWGLSLWLTVPLALAWGWWSGAGPGWPWIAAGALTAAAAATASLAASGWR